MFQCFSAISAGSWYAETWLTILYSVKLTYVIGGNGTMGIHARGNRAMAV